MAPFVAGQNIFGDNLSRADYMHLECEVPCCKIRGHQDPGMRRRQDIGKVLCLPHYNSWGNNARGRNKQIRSWEDQCEHWEQVQKSKAPPTFQKTKFKPVPVAGSILFSGKRVKYGAQAQCQRCVEDGDNEKKAIRSTEYQLCATCSAKEQYIGETCWCCERVMTGKHQMSWIPEETIFGCQNCTHRFRDYELPSYKFLKEDVLPVKDCQMCGIPIFHNNGGGQYNTACVHHDHDTLNVLGVVCFACNVMDEWNARTGLRPTKWGKSCEAFRKKVKKNPLLRITPLVNLQVGNPPLKTRDYRSYWQRLCGFFRQGHA